MTAAVISPAETALTILEQMARDLEQAQRYQPQDKRTVEHVIDATPMGPTHTYRLRLLVAMAYPPFYEEKTVYSVGVVICERAKVRAHLEYGCLRYPALTAIRLSRAQAIDLLETRELPVALWPAAVAPADDWDVLAFLDDASRSRYVGRIRGPGKVRR